MQETTESGSESSYGGYSGKGDGVDPSLLKALIGRK